MASRRATAFASKSELKTLQKDVRNKAKTIKDLQIQNEKLQAKLKQQEVDASRKLSQEIAKARRKTAQAGSVGGFVAEVGALRQQIEELEKQNQLMQTNFARKMRVANTEIARLEKENDDFRRSHDNIVENLKKSAFEIEGQVARLKISLTSEQRAMEAMQLIRKEERQDTKLRTALKQADTLREDNRQTKIELSKARQQMVTLRFRLASFASLHEKHSVAEKRIDDLTIHLRQTRADARMQLLLQENATDDGALSGKKSANNNNNNNKRKTAHKIPTTTQAGLPDTSDDNNNHQVAGESETREKQLKKTITARDLEIKHLKSELGRVVSAAQEVMTRNKIRDTGFTKLAKSAKFSAAGHFDAVAATQKQQQQQQQQQSHKLKQATPPVVGSTVRHEGDATPPVFTVVDGTGQVLTAQQAQTLIDVAVAMQSSQQQPPTTNSSGVPSLGLRTVSTTSESEQPQQSELKPSPPSPPPPTKLKAVTHVGQSKARSARKPVSSRRKTNKTAASSSTAKRKSTSTATIKSTTKKNAPESGATTTIKSTKKNAPESGATTCQGSRQASASSSIQSRRVSSKRASSNNQTAAIVEIDSNGKIVLADDSVDALSSPLQAKDSPRNSTQAAAIAFDAKNLEAFLAQAQDDFVIGDHAASEADLDTVSGDATTASHSSLVKTALSSSSAPMQISKSLLQSRWKNILHSVKGKNPTDALKISLQTTLKLQVDVLNKDQTIALLEGKIKGLEEGLRVKGMMRFVVRMRAGEQKLRVLADALRASQRQVEAAQQTQQQLQDEIDAIPTLLADHERTLRAKWAIEIQDTSESVGALDTEIALLKDMHASVQTENKMLRKQFKRYRLKVKLNNNNQKPSDEPSSPRTPRSGTALLSPRSARLTPRSLRSPSSPSSSSPNSPRLPAI